MSTIVTKDKRDDLSMPALQARLREMEIDIKHTHPCLTKDEQTFIKTLYIGYICALFQIPAPEKQTIASIYSDVFTNVFAVPNPSDKFFESINQLSKEQITKLKIYAADIMHMRGFSQTIAKKIFSDKSFAVPTEQAVLAILQGKVDINSHNLSQELAIAQRPSKTTPNLSIEISGAGEDKTTISVHDPDELFTYKDIYKLRAETSSDEEELGGRPKKSFPKADPNPRVTKPSEPAVIFHQQATTQREDKAPKPKEKTAKKAAAQSVSQDSPELRRVPRRDKQHNANTTLLNFKTQVLDPVNVYAKTAELELRRRRAEQNAAAQPHIHPGQPEPMVVHIMQPVAAYPGQVYAPESADRSWAWRQNIQPRTTNMSGRAGQDHLNWNFSSRMTWKESQPTQGSTDQSWAERKSTQPPATNVKSARPIASNPWGLPGILDQDVNSPEADPLYEHLRFKPGKPAQNTR